AESTFQTLNINSGALSGTGTVTVSGPTIWTGGDMSGGGTTNANGGLKITGGTHFIYDRTINITGNSEYSGGILYVTASDANSAVLTNNGAFDLKDDLQISNYSTSNGLAFNNL